MRAIDSVKMSTAERTPRTSAANAEVRKQRLIQALARRKRDLATGAGGLRFLFRIFRLCRLFQFFRLFTAQTFLSLIKPRVIWNNIITLVTPY